MTRVCYTTLCALLASVCGIAQPQQPTNVSPPNHQNNVATNQVSMNVSNTGNRPMTVKLYGRLKPAGNPPNFTIIGLPDTQYYTEEPQGGPSGIRQQASNAIFKAQTQWIADNRTNRNIVFVSQLGDCTQNGQANEIEWKRVDTSMKKIESPNVPVTNGIPYSMCVGNHDQGNAAGDPSASTVFFNQYFGESRFTGRSYYGGHYGTNNDNHFELFSASGVDFIHISLEFNNNSGTTNKALLLNVLNWADSLLKAHPGRKGIVASHWIMEVGTNAAFGGPGAEIYNQLKDNPNFLLMLCGHQHGEGRRTDLLNNGSPVHTMLSDYQARTNGGNGFLRMLEFSPSTNMVSIKTYSPWLNQFETDADSEFSLPVDLSRPYSLIATNTNVSSGASTSFTWNGLLPATSYDWYVTIDDGVQVTTSTVFDFTTAGALPVTLVDLKAGNAGKRVKVEWSTATEINTSHFEVEHSADGRTFNKIATVAAGARKYFAFDDEPFAGRSYYRLKMVDNDGNFIYSAIVYADRTVAGSFSVMPNPAVRNQLRLVTQDMPAGNATINIYDQSGRLQFSRSIVITGQPLVIPHQLSAGLYHVELEMKGIKETKPVHIR